MADDTIQLKFRVDAAQALEATRKQQDEIKKLEKLWNAAGDAERKLATDAVKLNAWKVLNTDVSALGGAMRDATPRLAAFGGSLANVTKGVAAGAGIIAGAGVAFVHFAASIEQNERTIRRLGAAYSEVSAQTSGAISAQQALTLQGQLSQAGVAVQSRQLGLLARAAREYADATGNDASEAIEKLTNAIVNNSADALSELDLSQARATTSTQTLANMVRELETRYRGVAPAARTLNEDLAKLPDMFATVGAAALGAARNGLEAFINRLSDSSTAGRRFFDGVRRGWTDVVELGDTMRTLDAQSRSNDAAGRRSTLREGILNRARTLGVRVSADDLQGINEARLTTLSRQLDSGFAVNGRIGLDAAFSQIAGPGAGLAAGAYEGMLARIRGEMDRESRKPAEGRTGGSASTAEERLKDSIAKDLSNAAGGAADVFERTAKRIETANIGRALEELTLSAKRTAGFFGSMRDDLFAAQGISPMNEANDLAVGAVGANRALRNRYQTIGNALGLNSATDDEQADLFNSIASAQEGGGAAAREARARRSRIAARDQGTRRMAREQSLGGRVASGLGFATDDEGRIANFDGMAAGAELLTGTVNSLTSGLSTLFDTLVSGSADAGTAFQLFASNLLSELGKMAMNKGLFYTFEGIAALFTAPPAAPAYFAAGAGLLALGAGLGIAGAATRPQVPAAGAGDASSARSLAPRASSGGGGSRGLSPVTVVLSSLVPAGPSDAQRLGRGLNDARRRGYSDSIPRRIQY